MVSWVPRWSSGARAWRWSRWALFPLNCKSKDFHFFFIK
jgi:hypothetical protein